MGLQPCGHDSVGDYGGIALLSAASLSAAGMHILQLVSFADIAVVLRRDLFHSRATWGNQRPYSPTRACRRALFLFSPLFLLFIFFSGRPLPCPPRPSPRPPATLPVTFCPPTTPTRRTRPPLTSSALTPACPSGYPTPRGSTAPLPPRSPSANPPPLPCHGRRHRLAQIYGQRHS